MIIYPEECKLSQSLIFDSHAHFDDDRFDECRNELLSDMSKNGVCGIITCGCDADSSKKALEIADRFDFVYAAVGIHPGCLDSGTTIEQIRKLCNHKKCVAIGEIGLDYYWQKDNIDFQHEVFEQQILLAKELDLPIIVHDREAHADTLELLKKHKPKGVVHCFSGSPEMAQEILKLGMYIGIGGVVTFKNCKKLPQVTELVPDDKLLIETDSPYLAPEPYRGKTCHSGFIPLTAQKIAEIRGTDAEAILKLTAANARTLFNIG